jgi:hypothetical protein
MYNSSQSALEFINALYNEFYFYDIDRFSDVSFDFREYEFFQFPDAFLRLIHPEMR